MKHQCPRCQQTFSNKGALDRHMDERVKPCEPAPAAAGHEAELLRRAWAARDLLRKTGVTGKEALNCIAAAIALREIERVFPRLADLKTYKLSEFMQPVVEQAAETPLGRFSGIVAHVFNDGTGKHWAEIVRSAFGVLEYHPDTRNVCKPLYEHVDKLFPLQDGETAKKLLAFVDKYMAFDYKNDNLGRLFMSIVRGMLAGKELGQFFTPGPVVAELVRICSTGRELGHVYDPTCGSGGFLAHAAAAKAASTTGTELDTQVHLLAYINVLLVSGKAPAVQRCDALTCALPTTPEGAGFDTILANPPFGVKGHKWETVVAECPDGAASYPTKCATSTGLFLQRIVRSCKVGGVCAVVLPMGREIAGQGAADKKLRHAILRACDLQKVIVFPAGTFETTSIKTCALILRKTRELGDTLKTTGVKRLIQSVDKEVPYATAQTELLELADGQIRPFEGAPARVTIAKVEAAGWSFSPEDFREEAAGPAVNNEDGEAAGGVREPWPMVKLGELFTMKKGTIKASRTVPGPFPVISIGLGKTHEFSTDCGEVLALSHVFSGGFGSCGVRIHYHNGPCAVTDIMRRLIPVQPDSVDLMFVALVLRSMLPQINACEKGLANKTLDHAKFNALRIPLPPLERQRRISGVFAELTHDIEGIENAAAAFEKRARIALERELYGRGGILPLILNGAHGPALYPMVKLGDVCSLAKGKTYTTKARSGQYSLYTSAKAQLSSDTPDESTSALLIACEGTVGYTHAVPDGIEYAVGHRCYILRSEQIDYRFVSLWMNTNRKQITRTHARGAVTQTLNRSRITNIQIPLPPLEVQQRIAAEVSALAEQAEALKKQAAEMRAALPDMLRGVLSTPPMAAEADVGVVEVGDKKIRKLEALEEVEDDEDDEGDGDEVLDFGSVSDAEEA